MVESTHSLILCGGARFDEKFVPIMFDLFDQLFIKGEGKQQLVAVEYFGRCAIKWIQGLFNE